MIEFFGGVLAGWLVTGVTDYYVARRALRKAFLEGQADMLRQVGSW